METLELIRKPVSEETAKQLFERIYKPGFLQVARYVSKKGGTFEDAKDIFHDALVLFYEQRVHSKSIESEINYLTGIAKHLWIQKFNIQKKNVTVTESFPEMPTPLEPTLNEIKLLTVLEQTGKRCLDLLVSFYSGRLTRSKIASVFNFTSEHSASVQKFKCIERVREVIKTNSMTYEDFFE